MDAPCVSFFRFPLFPPPDQLLLPPRTTAAQLTIMFLNESDISLAVGASYFSGRIETPAASRSSIILISTGGRVSSVALIVNLTICICEPMLAKPERASHCPNSHDKAHLGAVVWLQPQQTSKLAPFRGMHYARPDKVLLVRIDAV